MNNKIVRYHKSEENEDFVSIFLFQVNVLNIWIKTAIFSLRLLVATLMISKVTFGLDIKCTYDSGGFWGPRCDISQRIQNVSESETFTFSGLTREQKYRIKALGIKDWRVDFIPKETLTEFPWMDAIMVFDENLKVVTFDYVSNLLKFMKNRIKKLCIKNLTTVQIDPILKYLKYSEYETELKNCTENEIQDCKFNDYQEKCPNFAIKKLQVEITKLKQEIGRLDAEVQALNEVKSKVQKLWEEFESNEYVEA